MESRVFGAKKSYTAICVPKSRFENPWDSLPPLNQKKEENKKSKDYHSLLLLLCVILPSLLRLRIHQFCHAHHSFANSKLSQYIAESLSSSNFHARFNSPSSPFRPPMAFRLPSLLHYTADILLFSPNPLINNLGQEKEAYLDSIFERVFTPKWFSRDDRQSIPLRKRLWMSPSFLKFRTIWASLFPAKYNFFLLFIFSQGSDPGFLLRAQRPLRRLRRRDGRLQRDLFGKPGKINFSYIKTRFPHILFFLKK